MQMVSIAEIFAYQMVKEEEMPNNNQNCLRANQCFFLKKK